MAASLRSTTALFKTTYARGMHRSRSRRHCIAARPFAVHAPEGLEWGQNRTSRYTILECTSRLAPLARFELASSVTAIGPILTSAINMYNDRFWGKAANAASLSVGGICSIIPQDRGSCGTGTIGRNGETTGTRSATGKVHRQHPPANPVRARYRMPFNTSRKSTPRRRPVFRGFGRSPSTCPHSSSVRSVG